MPPERPTQDTQYTLGRIEQALETITRTLSENRTADAQYRTGVREEMTRQRESINEVKNKLSTVTDDVAEMKPTVKSLETRAMMSKGAANFAIWLGKGAHVISAGIGGIFAVLLERWLRGSH